MKTAALSLLVATLVIPAVLRGDVAPAPEAPPAATGALLAEFRQLQDEIIHARAALANHAEIVALRELQAAAVKINDVVSARKHAVEIRRKTEELLAEQPGMAEKLARFRELGETMRRDLPAEIRRKGKRLPKTDGPRQPPAALENKTEPASEP